MPNDSADQYKHIRQDSVNVASKSADSVKDGGAAALSHIVPFLWGPAVIFPRNIKHNSISHASKLKVHFPLCVHFGKTQLTSLLYIHNSARLLSVLCTLVACVSLHKALAVSPRPHFLFPSMYYLSVLGYLCFLAFDSDVVVHWKLEQAVTWWLYTPWNTAEVFPVSLWHYRLHEKRPGSWRLFVRLYAPLAYWSVKLLIWL